MIAMTRQSLALQQALSVRTVPSQRKLSSLDSSHIDGNIDELEISPIHHKQTIGVRPETFIGFIRPMGDTSINKDGVPLGFELETNQFGSSYLNKDAFSKWNEAESWPFAGQSPDGAVVIEAKTKCGHLHGYGALSSGKTERSLSYREWQAHSHMFSNECQPHLVVKPHNGESCPLSMDGGGQKHCVKRATIPHSELLAEKTKKMDSLKSTSSAQLHSCLTKGKPYNGYPVADGFVDMQGVCITRSEKDHSFLKSPSSRIQKPTSDCHTSIPSPNLAPGNSVRSVSMRDTGTEMTPIASQEPSRTGTPIRAATPAMRSPILCSPSPPREGSPIAAATQARKLPAVDGGNKRNVRQTQGQPKTHETHEGSKVALIAWANKEREYIEAAQTLKHGDTKESKANVFETRATAWEQAEEAKYLARFKREEAKILAWRNHEKAKAEAEQRRIEVVAEKRRLQAQEKLRKSLEAAKQKAEARHAAGCEQASRAVHILPTGRLYSSFFSCGFCY